MKRIGIALSIAAALALAPAAAEASTGHTCPTHCTPAPTPPPGGWKCQQTHSCRPPKHPHCKPKKHHHKVTKPPSSAPVPPVLSRPAPAKHKKHNRVDQPAAHVQTVAAVTPPELAFTGAETGRELGYAAAFVVLGGALVGLSHTPSKQRKAWKR